ncbi:MAG TPA: histidine phosphatase family protein [Solirubrobacteraceae bacterium]
MARQLWLLRHAEAEPHGTREDSERRLTERGECQARAAGAALERLGGSFEAVLFSPKMRARQTAELAAEAWADDQRERLAMHAPLADGFDGVQALEAIAGLDADGRLLLVGHEPDMSRVLAQLTGARADVKKGGVAAVRLQGAGGELLVLLRPRELALIAAPVLGAVGSPPGRE